MTRLGSTTKRGSRRGTEGAVMVEFLAVFMPIFTFFLGLLQLIFIQTANLVINHAAHVAVRAAVVLVPDKEGGSPGTAAGAKKAMIEKAARVPLAALGVNQSEVSVALDAASYDINAPITVTVTVDFPCRVPLGGLIACAGNNTTLSTEATMVNQGAEYKF